MFFKKKVKKMFPDGTIVAPVDGEIYPTEEISDSVFADQILGKTIVFRPSQGELTLVAPANGKLEVLYPTGHAYAIQTSDGKGILVHIGIDTVEMNGDGFKTLAKQGADVVAGQEIVKADFAKIAAAGYDTSVMLILTENGEDVSFKDLKGVQAVIMYVL